MADLGDAGLLISSLLVVGGVIKGGLPVQVSFAVDSAMAMLDNF
jgi:hypothetical protein